MTAEYTYGQAAVLVQAGGVSTDVFAVGAHGVLRTAVDGPESPIYDINGSPLPYLTVGETGAYQFFRADIPFGVLDFGSALITAVSNEAIAAPLEVKALAESALSQVETMQTSKAAIIHTHLAGDVTDFEAAVLAVPGVGEGGSDGVGLVDGGTPDSTFSDVYLDGGDPDGGGGLRLVSDMS